SLARQNIANIAIAVLDELGVKGQTVDRIHAADLAGLVPAVYLRGEVEEQIRFVSTLVLGKRIDLAGMLAYEETVGTGGCRNQERILKSQLGKDPLDLVRRRRLRRAGDARSRPGSSLLDAVGWSGTLVLRRGLGGLGLTVSWLHGK